MRSLVSGQRMMQGARKVAGFTALLLAITMGLFIAPQCSEAAESISPTYRVYNPYSGEHLYTLSAGERDSLVASGWMDEGTCWYVPNDSTVPVYRLYNRYSGEHLYTTDYVEYDSLGKIGWNREGVAFYSDEEERATIIRLFNPYETVGTHLYTSSAIEASSLEKLGWKNEGESWYAVEAGTPIMGSSSVTSSQLAAYYRSVVGESTYPSSVYAGKGAATIDDFCRILVEEADAEGVRAEVVFVQAMKETGWLRFGGAVQADWCNFAGLGAVNSSPTSAARFPDVRTGLRAQVQHLKAYATTDPLNNACVDPRFNLVTRGCAPTLEGLNGKWAVPGNGYGESLASMIDNIMASL